MDKPIVFISHWTIKPGRLEDLKHLAGEVVSRMEAEKPRTLTNLAYFDDDGTHATFVHAFADAESMDLHFLGADDRTTSALELMEPDGWEIYGRASDAALESMREAAAAAKVPLTVLPDFLAGFMRLHAL